MDFQNYEFDTTSINQATRASSKVNEAITVNEFGYFATASGLDFLMQI